MFSRRPSRRQSNIRKTYAAFPNSRNGCWRRPTENVDYGDSVSLAAALEERSCTIVTVTVPEGSSSAQICLDEMFVYRLTDEGWTKTETPWEWTDNGSYSVVKLDCGRDFDFGSFNNVSGVAAYSFTYTPAQKMEITCVNINRDWTIKLYKTDASDHTVSLRGAVFALYSPASQDQLTDAQIEEARADASLDAALQLDKTRTEGAVVYYLADIVVTGQSGTCTLENLLEDSYLLLELQAPAGYNLDSTVYKIDRDAETLEVDVTIENTSGYVLPLSGGNGTARYYTAGTVLMLVSCCGGYVIWLKRRKWDTRG